jgi:hypothetical protein
MPEKTQRSRVGQAWLAQRVGVSLSPAFIIILLPRQPFCATSRCTAVSKTFVFERKKGWNALDNSDRLLA